MERNRFALIFLLLLIFTLNLSCGATGSAIPGKAEDPTLYEFTGEPNPRLARLDNKTFKPEEFISRSLPVEVAFQGEESTDVIMKGALIQPNMNLESHSPSTIDAILVLEKTGIPLFEQANENIALKSLRMDAKIDLLDAGGATLFSYDHNDTTLYPGYPQYFRFYSDGVPDDTTSVKITLSFEDQQVIPTWTEAESLNFQVPGEIFQHTPVQYVLEMDDWNEEYAKKAAVASFNMKFKNPYAADIDYQPMVIFLNEAGNMVGWMELAAFLPASGVMERPDDPWQSSYLSGEPASVFVIDKFPIDDLYKAME